MANPAQAILSIGGAFIGFWIGGPAGAAWGYRLDRVPGAAAVPCDGKRRSWETCRVVLAIGASEHPRETA